jgi:hypothetical protein
MCTGDMMQHDRMSSRMTAPAHAAMPADAAAAAHPAPMAGH